MSLETNIEKLTAAVDALNTTMQAMMAGAQATQQPATEQPEPEKTKAEPAKKSPVKKTPVKKAEPAPEPEPAEPETDEDTGPTITLEQLKAKFSELGKAKGGKEVKAILTDYGYGGFSDVPADDPQLDAMYREAEAKLEG